MNVSKKATPLELNLSYSLELFKSFVPQKHAKDREAVVNVVANYFHEYVQTVNQSKNVPFRPQSNYYGQVHTFGSFRLGVYTWGTFLFVSLLSPLNNFLTFIFVAFSLDQMLMWTFF